jgi:NADH dehydrogenase (ubiquinone) Fe-S protein 1
MNNGYVFDLDGITYTTTPGNTAIQAALATGFDIPRFCYHEKLSIAGNCRMCLLEISYPKSLKPMASCALPLVPGMAIYTNTMMVKKAREGVLELLLINHPLDCPVCDQGGECDLQDETFKFGGDRGRFYESKRAVEDKECGPIVKTSMNRCIHCTKCVRFCQEICGEPSLGTLGRGSAMEIGTYVNNEAIESEFSGNLIDLCPVGALTSKPYAFKARPWELRNFETVDVIDSLGSRIRVDIRGTEILRILPSQVDEVNEDWITDRTRFSYDGLKTQRLYSPMLKIKGNLVSVSWETAFKIAGSFLDNFVIFSADYFNFYLNNNTPIFGLFGDLADSESLVILNDFFKSVGGSSIFFQENLQVDTDFRSSYLLNLSLDIIEKVDFCVLVGLNVRLELPLLNLRLRKSFLSNNGLIISFGFVTNLTYHCFQQGHNMNSFFNFLKGKLYASKALLDSSFPIICVGPSFVKNVKFSSFLESFNSIIKYSNLITTLNWCGLNLVDSRISLNSSRELSLIYQGLNESPAFGSSFLYLYGVEKLDFKLYPNSLCFKIFHGHSGDINAFSSDVIFPGCTFVEKESLYITLEGRIQKTKFLVTPPSFVRTDWKIISAFRIFFFKTFYYPTFQILFQFDNIKDVKNRLLEYSPSFKIVGVINSKMSHKFFVDFTFLTKFKAYKSFLYTLNFIFTSNHKNFFTNNSITKISKIMSICAGRYSLRQSNFWK